MDPNEMMAQHQGERKLPSLGESIDFYQPLQKEIKRLEEILSTYKQVIMEEVKEGKTFNSGKIQVEHKPGQVRFSYYENPDLLYPYLEDAEQLTECTSLNRSAINKAIKEGQLPEEPFKISEITKTITSTLKFSKLRK